MRIGFVVRTRATKHVTSGITSALFGWEKILKKQGHIVDFIFDEDNFSYLFTQTEGTLYFPDKILPKKTHSELFEFKDSFNLERCINFRNSLVKAVSEKIYDVLICNDAESVFAAYQLNLYDKLKLIYFQHESGTFFENKKYNVYKECFYDLIENFKNNSFYIAYPSETVFQKRDNTFILPLPLDEIMLENDTILEKEGILFSGRIETRKNFEFFCEAIVRTNKKYNLNLKVKVMTCYHHIEKCETILFEHGLTNYEIKNELSGKEKFDFIKSAKISFCPSFNETFGLSAFEGLRYHPTILLNEHEWYKTFVNYKNLVIANGNNIEDAIFENYMKDITLDSSIEEYKNYAIELEKALLDINKENIFATEKTFLSKNKLFEVLKTLDKYIPLSELRKHDPKNELYLSSDIEPFYKANNLLIFQTNSETLISLKEENEIILPEKKNNFSVEREQQKKMQNSNYKANRMKHYQFSWYVDGVEKIINLLASNKKVAHSLFKENTKVEKGYTVICIEEKYTRKYRFDKGEAFFLRGEPISIKEDDYNKEYFVRPKKNKKKEVKISPLSNDLFIK